jgi:hypothetical protein
MSVMDFEAALTSTEVRVSQIIQGALASGIALFLTIVVLMYVLMDGAAPTAQENLRVVNLLSLVHIGLAVALYGVSQRLYDAQFAEPRLSQRLGMEMRDMQGRVIDDPAQKCLYLMRSAMIIRLACYEGAALFGLVVCLLAVVTGVLHAYPLYWLNALTSVLVLGHLITTLPTADRLKSVFLAKIKKAMV